MGLSCSRNDKKHHKNYNFEWVYLNVHWPPAFEGQQVCVGVCSRWRLCVCYSSHRFCGADTFRSGASIGMLLAGYSDVGIDVEICGSSRETHLLTWPQTEQVKPPTDIGKWLLPQHKWHCSVCPTECFDLCWNWGKTSKFHGNIWPFEAELSG